MSRLVLFVAVLGLALPAAAQTPESTLPQAYRLDIRTPGSMYTFSPNQLAFLPRSRSWDATLDGQDIPEDRFYELVGRADLARKAQRRRVSVLTMTTLGVAATAVGAVMIARGTPTIRACRSRRGRGGDFTTCDAFDPALTAGGTALVVGGVASISFALPLTKRAIPARDAAAEARRFNDDH